MGITLKQLLEELERDGVVGEEAEEAVARFVQLRGSRRGTGAIERRRSEEAIFPSSPQTDPGAIRRAVDYGNESKEEARARWLEQEQNDPDGIFGGGAVSGGIFGEGMIASERYDPEARMRQVRMEESRATAQAQTMQVAILQRMAARLGIGEDEIQQLLAPEPPSRRLKGHR
jgi:hypothetical protein